MAACFIDSIATLGLNGDGVGLNYHFGLFQQVLKNNQQETIPNAWLTDQNWLVRSSRSYQVPFAHFTLTSTLGGNWSWRMTEDQLTPAVEETLLDLTTIYRRINENLVELKK